MLPGLVEAYLHLAEEGVVLCTSEVSWAQRLAVLFCEQVYRWPACCGMSQYPP